MKRHAPLKGTQTTNWPQFVVMILAFIGLWQVLLGASTMLRWLF
ncbi:hypothetical protein [Oculatella sp. LEGE 06141]|nr:hypothetical protein [Oculatella sp. LEGE 06141]